MKEGDYTERVREKVAYFISLIDKVHTPLDNYLDACRIMDYPWKMDGSNAKVNNPEDLYQEIQKRAGRLSCGVGSFEELNKRVLESIAAELLIVEYPFTRNAFSDKLYF
ncbi:MAG: hypothetical protein Q7S56_03740 [Nanoarchaeota archaeon]|nr:hypothetical protein [Nanoarchaeota archaeon]